MTVLKRKRDSLSTDSRAADEADLALRKRAKSDTVDDSLPPPPVCDEDDLEHTSRLFDEDAAAADDDEYASHSDEPADEDDDDDDEDEDEYEEDEDEEDEDEDDSSDPEFSASSRQTHSASRNRIKFSAGSAHGKSNGSWSKKDDDALLRAVKAYDASHGKKVNASNRDWKAIATGVKGKTEAQCSNRWQKVLNPTLIKGPWTAEEDELLRRLVTEHGARHWTKIASYMKGRVGKQCNERWHNHLAPELRKGPFTPEEDRILMQKQLEFGNKWAIIATFLPGRAQNTIKNRWNATLKRRRLSPIKPTTASGRGALSTSTSALASSSSKAAFGGIAPSSLSASLSFTGDSSSRNSKVPRLCTDKVLAASGPASPTGRGRTSPRSDASPSSSAEKREKRKRIVEPSLASTSTSLMLATNAPRNPAVTANGCLMDPIVPIAVSEPSWGFDFQPPATIPDLEGIFDIPDDLFDDLPGVSSYLDAPIEPEDELQLVAGIETPEGIEAPQWNSPTTGHAQIRC